MEADSSSQWRFAQCFGDKGEVEDITEGESSQFLLKPPLYRLGQHLGCIADFIICVSSGHHLDRRI